MSTIDDHPLRFQLTNELHARPFPMLDAPSQAVYLAIKPAANAAGRDRDADRAHLLALLDRYGAQHPQPSATHFSGEIGKFRLKWENHTEFVTYTVFGDAISERPFDPALFEIFPSDWLQDAPGTRVISALIQIESKSSEAEISKKLDEWFVPESLAVSSVVDGSAIIAGDFRIDPAGHSRFALFASEQAGARRIGRILQRITEIETYKTMAMLGLARVREMGGDLRRIEIQLTTMVSKMNSDAADAAVTLSELLDISAELEKLEAKSSFRFGATGAYETIVNQRIEVMREEHFQGRQTFAEFMMRRFDPAMRTVKATRLRLEQTTARAERAAELLRTRVDVERQKQNQKVLESMDRRADLQLRLQHTVEGLSVVAISYYAVNLAVYLLGPVASAVDISKTLLTAVVTPLVILGVWLMTRRIRRGLE